MEEIISFFSGIPLYTAMLLFCTVGMIFVVVLIAQARQNASSLKRHRSQNPGVADLLNWAAVIDDGIIINKNGSLMAAWLYRGGDNASATNGERNAVSRFINAALNQLGSGWMIHVDAIRRPCPAYSDPAFSHFPDPVSKAIRLRSHRTQYMPRIKFFYIEDALAKWASIQSTAAAKREAATIPETNEYLGDLDFGYSITGKASWKPVRVYNDGVKTILEMPGTLRQKEAPTLLIVRKDGRIFKKSEQVMVNYRVQNGRYIVDAVFDQAVLVVGVGGNQERVVIARTPGKRGK
jgi:hypothetical protein